MALTISKHAKERYAERIMDRESKTDAIIFIRDHEDKIQTDIEKMIEFGSIVFEGQSSRDPKKTVAVVLNGQWVVILDTKEQVVITLYCIDLGVGDEANKSFIAGATARIKTAKNALATTEAKAAEYIDTYRRMIEDAEMDIAKYRKLVRELEAKVEGCKQMIASFNADIDMAKNDVREAVETLIGKQHF